MMTGEYEIVRALKDGENVIEALAARVLGRVVADDVRHPLTEEVVVEAETQDEAFDKVCEASDFTKTGLGEVYVHEVEQMEGESE